jgi:hypothetical protein
MNKMVLELLVIMSPVFIFVCSPKQLNFQMYMDPCAYVLTYVVNTCGAVLRLFNSVTERNNIK